MSLVPPMPAAHDPYDSQMFNYLSWHNHPYHRHLHLFPTNPYPPQPVQIAHKVWILDCKSCGTFLTNRGMKAVLLLRPNVSLYSSDALPVNCSADTSNLEVLGPPPSCRSQHARTCECLTQTLYCHGCGSTVGYMIVLPCVRCTSSITVTNRATNGHRFVFHAGEIVGTERHYIPDEPGVIPFEATAAAMTSMPASNYSPSVTAPFPAAPHNLSVSTTAFALGVTPFLPRLQSPPRQDFLPTPPVDMADLSPVTSTSTSPVTGFFPAHVSREPQPLSPGPLSPPIFSIPSQAPSDAGSQENSPDPESRESSPPSLIDASESFSYGLPSEQVNRPPLKGGDVLFWHNLARHGEIPGVADPPLARNPSATAESKNAQKRLPFDR